MTRLAVNVYANGPDGPCVLMAGDDLPEWAVGVVGDHALADEPEPAGDGAKPNTRRR